MTQDPTPNPPNGSQPLYDMLLAVHVKPVDGLLPHVSSLTPIDTVGKP